MQNVGSRHRILSLQLKIEGVWCRAYCRPFCRYSPDTKVGGQVHEHGLWSYGDDKGRQNSYEAGKFSIQVT